VNAASASLVQNVLPMRLLVVEDYEPLREVVTRRLREDGYAVDAAANGAEGWWHAESNEYDVVLLDLMLPDLDGETVLRRIKAAGKRTRVLILSAKNKVDSVSAACSERPTIHTSACDGQYERHDGGDERQEARLQGMTHRFRPVGDSLGHDGSQ